MRFRLSFKHSIGNDRMIRLIAKLSELSSSKEVTNTID
jgi:hypothetical protein